MNSNNTALFTFLDHTADLGITVTGSSLRDLFEKAAQSMMQIMIKGTPGGKTTPLHLSVSGKDHADLMVRWLGEILYLFEGESKVVCCTEIDSVTKSHLKATLQIAPFNPKKHEVLAEIKAVTYHQIEVIRRRGHWQARIIFDL
ncbi:MAG: archease [Desulfobacterales bacterium]|nr:archease [Desulfobacterales bacterium]MBL7102322.1 archease [Desulfobacteraceae bacterium]MBL7173469.1 archease [Desulfobacteraceae bacterium]